MLSDPIPMRVIQNALDEGDLDDDLDAVIAAVARRKHQLGMTAVLNDHPAQTLPLGRRQVSVGARGVLKNGKPLYLNGAPFTVVKINPKRVVISLDKDWLDAHPQATRWQGDITAPRGVLDFTVRV
jgi:hypothetical protein